MTAVCIVAWSPDGTRLAVSSGDTKVALYDVATGELWRELERDQWVLTVTWSPDGATLAVGGGDRKVVLYDVATGELRRELEHKLCSFETAVWLRDGTVDGGSAYSPFKLALCDAATGELRCSLGRGPPPPRGGVADTVAWLPDNRAWSPDNRALAVAVGDGVGREWSVGDGNNKVALYDAATGAPRRIRLPSPASR